MTNEKLCGAIVLKMMNGRVCTLLVRQNAGHWGFHKGHTEQGETEEQTALREVLEETGLTIKIAAAFRDETHYSPKAGVYKDVVYFLAEPLSGTENPQKEEINQIEWVTMIDAMALLTFENDAMLLRSAVKYLKDHAPEGEELPL